MLSELWTYCPISLMMFVGVPLTIAALEGQIAMPQILTWYQKLSKPSWTPPSIIFGPAWTVIYALMGYSGWLVWRAGASPLAQALYVLQLLLNLSWQPVFFNVHDLGAALAIISALDAVLVLMIPVFATYSTRAAVALIPYLAWVSFATALNYSIRSRNRAQDGEIARRRRTERAAAERVPGGKVEPGVSYADKAS